MTVPRPRHLQKRPQNRDTMTVRVELEGVIAKECCNFHLVAVGGDTLDIHELVIGHPPCVHRAWSGLEVIGHSERVVFASLWDEGPIFDPRRDPVRVVAR